MEEGDGRRCFTYCGDRCTCDAQDLSMLRFLRLDPDPEEMAQTRFFPSRTTRKDGE